MGERVIDDREIHLIKEPPKTISVGVYVVGSLAVHLLLITFWFIYTPPIVRAQPEQLRYVEFTRAPETPEFVEGIGAPVETASRPDAPRSNANRQAQAPVASDGPRERRAGTPSRSAGEAAHPQQQRQQPAVAATPGPQTPREEPPQRSAADDRLTYQVAKAAATPAIDWKAAIRTVSGANGTPAKGGTADGDNGFAEAGAISFESQWFDWGDYADHMVRRIKLHWHQNMPEIIKVGVKGVVTLRFTIERDGTISEVVTVDSSSVPPYDFAARKAIQLSSKLNPLPANFTGQRERVTVRFFYNMEVKK